MSIIHLESENFNDLIGKGLTLVDFYADWCGPCKMLSPIIEELSNEVNDVKIIKVNIDEHSEIAQMYGVMSIPTLILFKDGKEINTNVGFIPKDEIIEFINTNQ